MMSSHETWLATVNPAIESGRPLIFMSKFKMRQAPVLRPNAGYLSDARHDCLHRDQAQQEHQGNEPTSIALLQ